MTYCNNLSFSYTVVNILYLFFIQLPYVNNIKHLFQRKEGALSPRFQASGSYHELTLEYQVEQEMTPNYSPTLEIVGEKDSDFTVKMTL